MTDKSKEERANFTAVGIGIVLALAYYVLIVNYLVDLKIHMEPFQTVLMILPPLEFLIVPAVFVISAGKLIYIIIQKLRGKTGITTSWKFLAFYAFSVELSACFIVAVYSITKK